MSKNREAPSGADPAAWAKAEAEKLLPCAGCEDIDNGLIWHAATCPVSYRQFAATALLAAEQRGVENERETCAKLAEMRQKMHDIRCNPTCRCSDGNHTAAAIRARGNK